MIRFLLEHKKVALLLFIVILSFLLMVPQLQKRPHYYFFEKPFLFLFFSIQRIFTTTVAGIDTLWEDYINLQDVKSENDRLKKEIEVLRARSLQHQEALTANERLHRLLGLKESIPIKTISAKVIGKDPTGWLKTLILDRGEKDGIKKDMGVISPAGVVGQVIRTSPDFSQILLIIDPNSAVAAMVQRTRSEGIGEGRGDHIYLKYLPGMEEVNAGDMVITSGLEGIYPKGLLIGTVRRVEKKEASLFQDIEVTPAVTFSALEEVLIVMANPSRDLRELEKSK